ncbi:hypothetical protein [Hafnia sp. HMSC23F03]|uniref:hypothetical protein n=1 Tax=Hafnia sp. HMSC23F03 TaxID=1581059 RepID=UPI00352AE195
MNRMHLIIVFIFLLGGLTISSMARIPEHVYLNESGMLKGVEDNILLKEYGQPEHQFIKPRYKFVGEYYIDIENTYRSTNPELKNIPIKEMFWHINSNLNLTCWFHYKDRKWTVISYIFWEPGTLF